MGKIVYQNFLRFPLYHFTYQNLKYLSYKHSFKVKFVYINVIQNACYPIFIFKKNDNNKNSKLYFSRKMLFLKTYNIYIVYFLYRSDYYLIYIHKNITF